MKYFDQIEKLKEPFKAAVVTIGNFDGVHLGHQSLFHEVIEKADAIHGSSVVITFQPHPIRVLTSNGKPPLITLTEQKRELIANTGIDNLICIPFTTGFSQIAASDFVKNILVERIGMKAIVVGQDYTFGKNREGNLDLLQTYSEQFGFEVIINDWIRPRTNGSVQRISSTLIRELVTDGDIEKARTLLGRYYQIRGTVAQGRDRGGRLLGFPTANVNLKDELCPKMGVYAVTVELDYRKFNAVANIGFSPTFDDHVFTVEVHILDFNDDIYGQNIRVNFIKRIRDEKKFAGISELSAQIEKDIAKAHEILTLL
ncbi:bifunctional riboflavin kinase/FAD synthetase [Desulfococcaceae bacterium HSG9]|nr:bifunctional riboflavin kinase/FAD synthetase [Desulfococcaceae bacterium HSG9]